jgi:adenosylcobinamide kinase/adenosylcobinamide-phosphate guanylyltransferase
MGKIILVTGGCRSGKSRFAQETIERFPGSRCFIATCPVVDKESEERIERHKQDRKNRNWNTLEEELNLSGAVGAASVYDNVLVDCLTLWVNNIMYNAKGADINEDYISKLCGEVIAEVEKVSGNVLFVTNEVGLGIVPENKEARLYRDLVGRCNSEFAKASEVAILVSCGLPVYLKGNKNEIIAIDS